MKHYLQLRKSQSEVFSLLDRLNAFFGAFYFSIIFFFPLYVMLIEFLIVYMYLVYPITILLFVLSMLYFYTVTKLYLKALRLKQNMEVDHPTVKKVALIHLSVFVILGFIITVCFLVWWIPLLLV